MSSWAKIARAPAATWTKQARQGHGCGDDDIEGWGEDEWGDSPWGSEE